MKVIGFNFTKLNIDKKSDDFKGLKVDSPNINISEIKQIKTPLFETKEDVFEIRFNYDIKYTPDVAHVSLGGILVVVVDKNTSKELVKRWKDKKLPDEYKLLIFNVILKKANLKAMQLEDEVNLPLHIPLPSIKEFK